MIELARQYGRYGYRRIAALLRDAGWRVNDKRVERLWQREGLKVPTKQPKKGRLWLNDGSCVRLRPEYRNHVWSYDFVHQRTDDGKAFRTLNILDEHSRECLAIRVKRRLNSTEVIDAPVNTDEASAAFTDAREPVARIASQTGDAVDLGDREDVALAFALACWYGEASRDDLPNTDKADEAIANRVRRPTKHN